MKLKSITYFISHSKLLSNMNIRLIHLSILIGTGTIFIHSSCQQDVSIQPLFEKLTPRETNITFENILDEEPLFNSVNYLYFNDGGGVAVGDINNDGLSDIYFTANMFSNRLYLNKGNFKFEDITSFAAVSGGIEGWTTGATMADVNSDGYLDIYVCRSNYLDRKGANQLFINNGDLTFTESAEEYGLNHTGLSTQAAFFDYDLDGDLDMYLLNHSVHSKMTYGSTRLREKIDYEAGDKLFQNNGGQFVDVTSAAGIYGSIIGYGLGVTVGDINWDGYPDIYISNDFHEDDYLYYNNGDGTFSEALKQSMGHTSSASMGIDLADVNNDGLLDVAVLDMLPEKEEILKSSVSSDVLDIHNVKLRFGYYYQYRRNTLQLNRGPSLKNRPESTTQVYLFSEIGQLANIHNTDWSWSPLVVDLDNDGLKDIFITNGIFRRPNDLDYLNYINQTKVQVQLGMQATQISPTPINKEMLTEMIQRMPSVPVANYAFHSQGDLTFSNRASEWGLGDPGFSSGAAYADFNNDGALDLVINNVNAPAAVYKNVLYENPHDSLNPVNYLKIKLVGKEKNTSGIGTKVILHYENQIFYQEMMPTRGFQSSVEPVLTFGLGKVDQLDSLEVIWATGEYQVLKDVATNQVITLNQAAATAVYNYQSQKSEVPILLDVTENIHLDYRHQENKFIEHNREPFIPHFLSTEGPALAITDVNGDGLADLFLGGAKHQPGSIFLQRSQGGFAAVVDSVFIKDDWSEDVDAIFFDANGDNRPDLYVVSGGNEFFGQANPIKDRLYLNNGHGHFRKTENLLPDIYANGACVKAADVDRDGDLDLFVGSRSIPRRYGMIPDSYLLINDGQGKFTDQTAQLAPELSQIGMVTDAVWVDLNQDSFQDLIIVGEWMPVTIFENENGNLVNATEKYGLMNTYGWWNTIVAADFNQDGNIDLVAGNLGLNSFLKAAIDRPVQLYINDFSGNGKPEQILTYYHGNKSYPLATLDLMLENIPSLAGKYTTYSGYAGQTIQNIFPREQLQTAEVRTANEFASLLLLNNGAESFSRNQLPVEAQFAPIYAILVVDFNSDGHPDLLLGGNFYGVAPDQGRYDASYGSLLLGDGTGTFAPVSLQKSGFAVTGEVRQMKSLQTASGETLVLVARNNDTVVVFRGRN